MHVILGNISQDYSVQTWATSKCSLAEEHAHGSGADILPLTMQGDWVMATIV